VILRNRWMLIEGERWSWRWGVDILANVGLRKDRTASAVGTEMCVRYMMAVG
jgi:hypothetical protein